jgi:hypothetical protein
MIKIREDEEEEISSSWITATKKREDTAVWRKKH